MSTIAGRVAKKGSWKKGRRCLLYQLQAYGNEVSILLHSTGIEYVITIVDCRRLVSMFQYKLANEDPEFDPLGVGKL
jgi:hypothetical protein